MTTIEGGAISGGSPEEAEGDRAASLARAAASGSGLVRHAAARWQVQPVGRRGRVGPRAAARAWRNSTPGDGRWSARYFELWGSEPPLRLPERGDAGHSWHVFAPLLPLPQLRITRLEFMEAMKQRGIGVGVHYPAIHLFSCYRALGYRDGQFPQCRAHRARDRDAAAVPGDAAQRRGARGRARPTRSWPEAAPMNPQVSVIMPVYNEEEGLPLLFERLYPALDALGRSYEVVFVDDGSSDRSVAQLREQFQRRPDVTRVVVLARNAGQHMAILAGVRAGARQLRHHAGCGPAEPARGDRAPGRGDGCRGGLRGHHPPQPPGRAGGARPPRAC